MGAALPHTTKILNFMWCFFRLSLGRINRFKLFEEGICGQEAMSVAPQGRLSWQSINDSDIII